MVCCRPSYPMYIAPSKVLQKFMALERTLGILKPDCVRKHLIGAVVARIEAAGFTVCGMRMVRLSRREAHCFYAVHEERPFFESLMAFMTSGPVVAMALEKDNAVQDFRTLIGDTDPAVADPGTVRRDYGGSKGENIVHGSDSVENGKSEIAFFFAGLDL